MTKKNVPQMRQERSGLLKVEMGEHRQVSVSFSNVTLQCHGASLVALALPACSQRS